MSSKKSKPFAKALPLDIFREPEAGLDSDDKASYLFALCKTLHKELHTIYGRNPGAQDWDNAYEEEINDHSEINFYRTNKNKIDQCYKKIIETVKTSELIPAVIGLSSFDEDDTTKEEFIANAGVFMRQVHRLHEKRINFMINCFENLENNFDHCFDIPERELTVIERIIKPVLTRKVAPGSSEELSIAKLWHDILHPKIPDQPIGSLDDRRIIFQTSLKPSLDLSTAEKFMTETTRPIQLLSYMIFLQNSKNREKIMDCGVESEAVLEKHLKFFQFKLLVTGPVAIVLPGLHDNLMRFVKLFWRLNPLFYCLPEVMPCFIKRLFNNLYGETKNPFIAELEAAIQRTKFDNARGGPGVIASRIMDLFYYIDQLFGYFPNKKKHIQAAEIVLREVIPLFVQELQKISSGLNKNINEEFEGINIQELDFEDPIGNSTAGGSAEDPVGDPLEDPIENLLEDEIQTYEELVQDLHKKPSSIPKSQPVTLERKVRKLVSLLRNMGFEPVRQNGTSHQIWKKGGKFTILPIHGSTVKSSIARSIYDTMGL